MSKGAKQKKYVYSVRLPQQFKIKKGLIFFRPISNKCTLTLSLQHLTRAVVHTLTGVFTTKRISFQLTACVCVCVCLCVGVGVCEGIEGETSHSLVTCGAWLSCLP